MISALNLKKTGSNTRDILNFEVVKGSEDFCLKECKDLSFLDKEKITADQVAEKMLSELLSSVQLKSE